MPFVHAESPAAQARSLALFTRLAHETGLADPLVWAEKHAVIIGRFGRYPHPQRIARPRIDSGGNCVSRHAGQQFLKALATIALMGLIEITLGLLLAVAAVAALGKWIGAPLPLLLVAGGVCLSFLPGFRSLSIAPDIFFCCSFRRCCSPTPG